MDYPLAISPDLQIDAEEFAAAWKQDHESSNMARLGANSKESYPFITPEMIQQA